MREECEQTVKTRTVVAQEGAQEPAGMWTEADLIEVSEPAYEIISAIYFLILNKRIVYVGQSVHAYSRLTSHLRTQSLRPFDSWAIIGCDPGDLNRVEAEYILAFDPPYNRDAATMARRAALIPPTPPPEGAFDVTKWVNLLSDEDQESNKQYYLRARQELLDRMAYLRAMRGTSNLRSPFGQSPEDVRKVLEAEGIKVRTATL